MVGNRSGVTAASNGASNNRSDVNGRSSAVLATVTADGANTVTVDSIDLLKVGMVVDIVTRSTLAVVASARTITGITSAGVVTYSGADVAATANESLYYSGVTEANGNNHEHWDFRSITQMKARLTAIDANYYTARMLNRMTYNDMLYAIRLNDYAGSIKQ